MSGFNEKGLTKKPRVTFEERRAREKAVANYAMAQAAGVGPLAPLFGIEPRKPEPAPRAKHNRPPVNKKYQRIFEAVLALPPGEAVEWADAPPTRVAHTLLTRWRQEKGLNVESYEAAGRRFVRRVA